MTRLNRNLQMPGDPRYQPDDLKPYIGYDQWAGWLIIVAWGWLKTLAKLKVMPREDAKYLQEKYLFRMLEQITTTMQDVEEHTTKHDIIALLNLMKLILPEPLHKWLHYCGTSYDLICTAYALQYQVTFHQVVLPKMRAVDKLWLSAISEHAETLQAARTHLQTALPISVGCWLAQLHNRYVRNCRAAAHWANIVEGKYSGAVGTFASQMALIGHNKGEEVLMRMLGLEPAPVSTQITPPESLQNCYHALMLVSGTLGNLGEDGRILQSSAIKELVSSSSTSSAMSHKLHNPIGSEQMFGMYRTVVSEYMLIAMNMVSDLQRDLSNSSCMRRYSSIIVYLYQQLSTAERWFKNLKINVEQCRKNFDAESRLLTAEVLHLSLGTAGLPDPHHFVNGNIIPLAVSAQCSLGEAMSDYLAVNFDHETASAWGMVPERTKELLHFPEKYIGKAVEIARKESNNRL